MNPQLSPRDWETLSAYLDRQLKPKETAHLEARLSSNPQLSAALGELQRTRDALRGLPKMRAPRNFTLTPQMVGQSSKIRSQPAGHIAPVLGFASAFATFILLLVVVGDLLGILTPTTKHVAQEPVATMEVALQVAATEVVEERVAKEAAPAEMEPAMPTNGDAVAAEALESQAFEEQVVEAPLMITETLPMSLTVAASPVMTDGLTLSAEEASGMGVGGGIVEDEGDSQPPSAKALAPEENLWTTTILLTISPTETLAFPMTVTIEGPAITETLDTATDLELTPEELLQAETAETTAPEVLRQAEATEPPSSEAPPAPEEVPLREPTGVPEELTLAPSPLPTSQPEQQVLQPTEDTSPQEPSTQPTRIGQPTVRLLEITLAILALIMGLAAAYFHWIKKL